ncbi:hypothetical protein GCM10022393_12290 [Aquimarina addita]|uniref:SUKH-4 immunity protein of toxin-antitoxin system n=1 Tax=Aquimarina addita TaxID=870485 RepID=A0ABP7XEJ2_9FLAO
MKKLIPKEERIHELLKFGAPRLFVENIGKIPELEFRIEPVEGAYFYLPTISNYEILKGFTILPIYDEGESFYVLAYTNTIQKIIHFELENDKVYDDYKLNWNLLLMDILIQYFEDTIDDEITMHQFKKVAEQLDFCNAEQLFNLLNCPIDEYNAKNEEQEKWRIEIAKELKIL